MKRMSTEIGETCVSSEETLWAIVQDRSLKPVGRKGGKGDGQCILRISSRNSLLIKARVGGMRSSEES